MLTEHMQEELIVEVVRQ